MLLTLYHLVDERGTCNFVQVVVHRLNCYVLIVVSSTLIIFADDMGTYDMVSIVAGSQLDTKTTPPTWHEL
jgi:hypothetical protein